MIEDLQAQVRTGADQLKEARLEITALEVENARLQSERRKYEAEWGAAIDQAANDIAWVNASRRARYPSTPAHEDDGDHPSVSQMGQDTGVGGAEGERRVKEKGKEKEQRKRKKKKKERKEKKKGKGKGKEKQKEKEGPPAKRRRVASVDSNGAGPSGWYPTPVSDDSSLAGQDPSPPLPQYNLSPPPIPEPILASSAIPNLPEASGSQAIPSPVTSEPEEAIPSVSNPLFD